MEQGNAENFEGKMMIAHVEAGKAGKVKVTIDSGAGVSVWPARWKCSGEVKALDKKIYLEAANGTPIKVEGERKVHFKTKAMDDCEMGFIVTDVTKPLAAVSAITKAGNKVVFGHGKGASYIQNEQTGERIPLTSENGTYMMEVEVAGLEVDFQRQK